MSRGPGTNEKLLKAYLAANAGWTTFETVRWLLAPQTGGKLPAKLSASWDTSLHRSLKTLAKRGVVEIKKRRLLDLDEVVAHYPNKTLATSVRELRGLVLPVIAQLEKSNGGLSVRYGLEANERHILTKLSPEVRADTWAQWRSLEVDLRHSLATQEDDSLLLLVMKGRSLFKAREQHRAEMAQVSWPLQTLINECERKNLIPSHTLDRLKRFYVAINPPSRASELKLKSLVHSYASIHGKSGPARLTPDAVRLLHENLEKPLTTLKAFEPAPQTTYAWMHPEPKPTPLLHKLFDRTIVGQFRFIRLNSGSSPKPDAEAPE